MNERKYLSLRPVAQILSEVNAETPPRKTAGFSFESKYIFHPYLDLKAERGANPAEMIKMVLAYLIENKHGDYHIQFDTGDVFIYLIRDKKTRVIHTAEGIEIIYHSDSFKNYTAQYRYHADVRFRLLKLPQKALTEELVNGLNFDTWLLNPSKHDKKSFGYNFYRAKKKK